MGKTYKERQGECGLKVGDKVRVLRKAESGEDGWGNFWSEEYMDDFVGRIGKIEGDDFGAGFRVFCEELNGWYGFPYFVLEKVEDEVTEKAKEPKSYKERQAECGLKVGDKVKVLRRANDWEAGWDNFWVGDYMDGFVGREGEIEANYGGTGLRVFCKELNDWFNFPYFVLEKVEDEPTSSYEIWTLNRDRSFLVENVVNVENTKDSHIFETKNGGIWEFYKKHIVAIKQY